ncbi:MAG: MFS transporter [Tropheryma whipplei]|uniref:MFS transporter n=1 Tax=Tropheryma whipplei TaxID=2039 RepID=UPI0004B572A0|nr:MFS transporter [Tropheryma whipplei]MCO8183050.1 MFS transporter [Tropheryma whipplei]
MVFIPSVLSSMVEGGLLPSVALIAAHESSSSALAGLAVSAGLIGYLASNIPGGIVVSRFGELRGMMIALSCAGISVLINIFSTSVALLTFGVFLSGFSFGAYGVARHSFMTLYTPLKVRARAFSVLGGAFRLGGALGTFLVSGVVVLTGNVRSVFVVHLAIVILLVIFLFLVRNVQKTDKSPKMLAEQPNSIKAMWEAVQSKKGQLITIGSAAGILAAARVSRSVILPLVGLHVGLKPEQITFIIGIGSTLEAFLFYSSGYVMDKWGRVWSAAPALFMVGGAYLLVFFAESYVAFLAISLLMGIGNALGSGIILTLGADLAGTSDQTAFISVWRLVTDIGQSVGPLGMSTLLGITSLTGAAGVMGLTCFAAAGIMIRYLHIYLPNKRAKT